MSDASEDRFRFNFLRYFKQDRVKVLGLGVLTLGAAQAESLAFLLVAPLAQSLAEGRDRVDANLGPLNLAATNRTIALGAIALILIAAALTIVAIRVRSKILSAHDRRQRDRLIQSFTQAGWGHQSGERAARLHTLTSFAHGSGRALAALTQGLRSGLSLVVFLALAFVIDWRSTMLIVVSGLVLVAGLWPLVRYVKRLQAKQADVIGHYAEELAECADQARDLRVFDAFGYLRDRLSGYSADLERYGRRSAFFGGIVSPLYQFSALAAIVVVLLLATAGTGTAAISIAAVALLLLRSLSYGQQLQTAAQLVVEQLPYIERFERGIAAQEKSRDADDGEELGPVRSLELRGVSYSYDGDEMALSGIDLVFESGSTVGLVGPSGSGKSTLSQILLRLRVPAEGAFLVNGQRASTYSAASFYRRVTHVPQEPRLLHGTVAENIAFLHPGITKEAVERAARQAGIHDAILVLPMEYDTPIGPGSRDLSGGQIQRIGIARALLRQPDVLVLDEPTSALDMHSEALVHDSLRSLPDDLIVVIIAHRLSTLKVCDRVVVLDAGRVAAAGSFEEVVNTNDFFKRSVEMGTLDLGEIAERT